MSLKPGLAKGWYEKFKKDVYPSDTVVLRGKRMRPPKYYDALLLSDPSTSTWQNPFDDVMFARELKALDNVDNNTLERLNAREQVQLAQISKLVKTL